MARAEPAAWLHLSVQSVTEFRNQATIGRTLPGIRAMASIPCRHIALPGARDAPCAFPVVQPTGSVPLPCRRLSVAWAIAAICGAGAVMSMVGDLAASAIKRNHDIKDYGKLIPGHGGIMDRFDSMIVTAPMTYFLTILTCRPSSGGTP